MSCTEEAHAMGWCACPDDPPPDDVDLTLPAWQDAHEPDEEEYPR